MATEPSGTVAVQRFELMVRWRDITFPFEQSRLLEVLPERGYVLAEGVRESPPIGGRIEVSGLAARKGSLRLTLDPSRPGLGVGGNEIVDAVDEFERIEEVLRDDLRFDSREHARFFEVDSQVLVWSEQSPIETIRERVAEHSFADQVGKVLKHTVAPFGFRFVISGELPGSEEWHELLIEPSIRSPENSYFGMLVFRRRLWEPVRDVAIRVSEIFEQLASEMRET